LGDEVAEAVHHHGRVRRIEAHWYGDDGRADDGGETGGECVSLLLRLFFLFALIVTQQY